MNCERTFAALRLLADGEFHSGEAMARELEVSRGSIWGALHVLDGSGIEVQKVRGRGYRLAAPLSLLDAAEVSAGLGARSRRFELEFHDCLPSTNTLMLERAAAGARSGHVVAAEWQSAGRGRRGRTWHAAPGQALTFSVLWRFQQGAGLLAGLSLAVGSAVAHALDSLNVARTGLKWPNDVMWGGRKLAGILIEIQGDVLGPGAAVIGIGLNYHLPPQVRDRIDQPVTDLAEAYAGGGAAVPLPGRSRVLAAVLDALDRVLEQYAHHGFAPLRAEWQRRHVYQGKSVKLALPDGAMVSGTVEGVAEDGALLLATRGGRRRFHGGEVSLRLPA